MSLVRLMPVELLISKGIGFIGCSITFCVTCWIRRGIVAKAPLVPNEPFTCASQCNVQTHSLHIAPNSQIYSIIQLNDFYFNLLLSFPRRCVTMSLALDTWVAFFI
jgi:hypothetical protein